MFPVRKWGEMRKTKLDTRTHRKRNADAWTLQYVTCGRVSIVSTQTKANFSATNYASWALRLDARERNDAQITFAKRRSAATSRERVAPFCLQPSRKRADYKSGRNQDIRQHKAGLVFRPPRGRAKGSIQSLESREARATSRPLLP